MTYLVVGGLAILFVHAVVKGYLSMTHLAMIVMGILFVLAMTGVIRRKYFKSPPADVSAHLHAGKSEDQEECKGEAAGTGKNSNQLFFYVHGLPGSRHEDGIAQALECKGTVVGLRYQSWTANTDPVDVAQALAAAIAKHAAQAPNKEIVLIGESMGALLIRRAYLDGDKAWTDRVTRMVLLAGLNRGWDLTGHKPSDMTPGRRGALHFLTWLARLTDTARLAMSMESGSPFVANLRLDWLDRLRADPANKLEVVQLRGDIDNIVSEQDSQDLDSVAYARYASLLVRGTDHGNIGNFADQTRVGDDKIGNYRRQKFVLAATDSLVNVQAESEPQPSHLDPKVTHVVFVLHGIRDLGEWSANFEKNLKKEFESVPGAQPGGLVINSARYGYLGMGPFLLLAKRQHYVQWLMDEYTEVRAKYPNAKEIHFFGHSNGTYLLASALENYRTLKIKRVAFGGSVVKKGYDWAKIFEERQVEQVRNYAAADDWVVALFPRFFEPAWSRWIFKNDLGSAGFNGFEQQLPGLKNVTFLKGGHGAFEERTGEISRFLLKNDATIQPPPVSKRAWYLNHGAHWATWAIVWPLLAIVLIFTGWHVTMSATEPRWPFVVSYVLLVLFILKSA